MTPFKPMLSGKAPDDLSKLRYPVLASPKLDGIRCVVLNGSAVTRTLKPVPNHFVRHWMEQNVPGGWDGELMLADHRAPFRDVTSAIMSHDGEPNFRFNVFDWAGAPGGFLNRYQAIGRWIENMKSAVWVRTNVVPHDRCDNEVQLRAFIDLHAAQGYEGTMVRNIAGPYKHGRSTTKEGYLLKIKAFADEEATVIGVEELYRNQNEATKDALGHTERSTKQAGMVAAGTLGALLCRFDDGTEFSVGSGFDDAERDRLWRAYTRQSPGGQLVLPRYPERARVKIKHQPPPGGRKPGEAPRFPTFLGFRHEDDQ